MVEYINWMIETAIWVRDVLTIWWVWLPIGAAIWLLVLKAYTDDPYSVGGIVPATALGSLSGAGLGFLFPFIAMVIWLFLPFLLVGGLVISLGFLVMRLKNASK